RGDRGLVSVSESGALLGGVGGDKRLLEKPAKFFLTDLPRLLARIRTASKAGDGEELAKAAHALKGAIGNFGATRAVAAAAELERLGKAGELSSVEGAWAALETELSVAKRGLEKLAVPSPKGRARARKNKRGG